MACSRKQPATIAATVSVEWRDICEAKPRDRQCDSLEAFLCWRHDHQKDTGKVIVQHSGGVPGKYTPSTDAASFIGRVSEVPQHLLRLAKGDVACRCIGGDCSEMKAAQRKSQGEM
jgi:hypothetical protein